MPLNLDNDTKMLKGSSAIGIFNETIQSEELTKPENLSRILLFVVATFIIILIILAKLLRNVCLQKYIRNTPVPMNQRIHLPDIISHL